MIDMDSLISKFINEEIVLSKKDISASAKSREWFLGRIKTKIEDDKNNPALYGTEPFVNFGSYFKGTKVSDADEYDILLVFDTNNGQFISGGNKIGEGIGSANPNHRYDQKFMKDDGQSLSPGKILSWLRGIAKEVVDEFGGTAPDRAGQAITVRIESKDISIDLVPAGIFSHTQRTGVEFYDIPRGDKDDGWIVTNPKQDKELLNDLGGKYDNFKNVIRITKYIKQNYNLTISSFAVECSAISYVQNAAWYTSVYANLKGFLAQFSEALKAKSVQDIFDTTTNLLSSLSDTNAEQYSRFICGINEFLEKIRGLDNEDKAYVCLCNGLGNKKQT